MKPVRAILFEPVGCLAEFPAAPFDEIMVRAFDHRLKSSRSGSRAYWHWLTSMEAEEPRITDEVRALELEAAGSASLYEDVQPALCELKAMNVQLMVASSLSRAAVARFLKKGGIEQLFATVWSRDDAGGVKTAPLRKAIVEGALQPEQTMYLTDTAEGLKVARSVGVQPILMMNDPDEAQRLAFQDPAGGIVSLHELPDFLRLLAAHHSGERPRN